MTQALCSNVFDLSMLRLPSLVSVNGPEETPVVEPSTKPDIAPDVAPNTVPHREPVEEPRMPPVERPDTSCPVR